MSENQQFRRKGGGARSRRAKTYRPYRIHATRINENLHGTSTAHMSSRLRCALLEHAHDTARTHNTSGEDAHATPGAGVRPATLATRTIFRPRALHTPRRRTHHTWCSSVSPCAPLAAPSLVRLNNPRIPIADTPFTHHPLSSRRHSPARPRLGGGAVGIPQVHDTALSDT